MKEEIAVMWFRRDLRIEDNAALYGALRSGYPVFPLFIYDTAILEKLERDDPRIFFLNSILERLDAKLRKRGSSLRLCAGEPAGIFKKLTGEYSIKSVHFNRDYEAYAGKRDKTVTDFLKSSGIAVSDYKDQVIFEKSEVVKNDGEPYTVFTPYSKKWLSLFRKEHTEEIPSARLNAYFRPEKESKRLSFRDMGFSMPPFKVKEPLLGKEHILEYSKNRDLPSVEGTSFLGPHLRFGTISIREVLRKTDGISSVFLNELIWREFFMQILWHYPHVTDYSFKKKYDRIEWINNEDHFRLWTEGKTGYPIVDAGMRELLSTGYMHNRVRMIAASFLVKHLLIDWRWGEAWFAQRLLDFELSSNNGNWQWAAGSGCDAAPWFRVFSPELQMKKFDPKGEYAKRWIPEIGTSQYPEPVTDHAYARDRAVKVYRKALSDL